MRYYIIIYTVTVIYASYYIGLAFDSTLSWEDYILNLQSRITPVIRVLHRLKNTIPRAKCVTLQEHLLKKQRSGFIAPAKIPQEQKSTYVGFLLYTRDNPSYPQRLNPRDNSTLEKLNATRDTKILIHGWKSNKNVFDSTTSAFLLKCNCNVIVVDWTALANNKHYTDVMVDTELVGTCLARILERLVAANNLSLAKVHIIGMGLGAHVAGIAGNRLSNGRVGRITGLDPGAALYSMVTDRNKLDRSDATYVDVIHTNADITRLGYLIGHADFYPNGGILQPGCNSKALVEVLTGTCSHGRSLEYYREAINSPISFNAVQCPTYQDYLQNKCYNNPKANMGDINSTSASGTYFLRTGARPPYANFCCK